jgi:hypothetical protein
MVVQEVRIRLATTARMQELKQLFRVKAKRDFLILRLSMYLKLKIIQDVKEFSYKTVMPKQSKKGYNARSSL